MAQGLVAEISGTTLWRWLNADALRPWQHRSWIFPRDPDFAAKAGRILDLYERLWEGVPLLPTDFVISADEKSSVQARRRKQPTLPLASGRPTRVEHEYFREGAWTYLAAWDVHRAKLFGRCEKKNGIAPTDRLMAEVMTQEPYQSAHRVFWIMDNCSAHRGQKAVQRIRSQWPNAILVHTPIHASWLNQIEIYFLSEHPKAAIHEHLKSGHTFRRNVQDIDSSGRVSSLSQYGECLERREETTNHSVGTTGMVSAKDPEGHASTSRDHQRLSARRRCGNMAAGKVEARR